MTVQASIGIGANLGDARGTVEQAIARLAALPASRLLAQSSLYLSAPIDSSGDDYINAVVQIGTGLSAHDLLAALQQIELAFGRERPYRNAPRTLDLDLLLYGSEQINRDGLIVPHPRMTERAFVLLPLLQANPLARIPGKGTVQDLVGLVKDQSIHVLK
ncbi:2-amino-4-hydroxy-6-hydroxymethyldihydropteridine diphosphokinase [Undibacterium sp. Jales W-56]|uniref:2-amino-4-hydroxy-6- hydroxymethyldihydropteridine diphosphokinase n=1 Tax=Undibacterium sp. Jales W-56 TaxID=2897325 RepID=UPI0021CE341A|nr:2-amino-4-hydroxy-6-hydroxymethyldihydropteridine diphosphokinase [Undibacterium sp. Jales W-56]MCU6434582.1 2-amino-4-hydroxy-6-hydroxymethyldihydropteridine diphosphokinase [Undibacterium sp. Jales W-56]